MSVYKICLLLLFFPLYINAQQSTNPIEQITENLQANFHSRVNETFQIHTNKNIFEQGETVWFNIFITDSISNKPIKKSRILYVDLVSDKDSVVKRVLLPGDKFLTQGSIDLKDSLLHGYYWIRAYTKRSFDNNQPPSIYPIYILNRRISTSNSDFPLEKKQSVVFENPIVNIYPEGDHLMSGVNTLVAVEVKDINGNPLKVSGSVFDNKHDTVARFVTNNFGIAKFNFSPFARKKYNLGINNENQNLALTTLPPVNMFAAQVAITRRNENSIHVRVLLEDSLFTKDYTTYLVCLHKDSICFSSIGKGLYELDIPKSYFPNGETTLLLYNSKKELLSTRHVYVENVNATISVKPNKTNYASKDNVALDINIMDVVGKPLVAELAVSILDSKIADSSNNYFNDPLLNESPVDRDLKMLVTKNNSNLWNLNEPHDQLETKNYLIEPFVISGHLLNKKNEIIKNRQITLLSKNMTSLVLQDTTDVKGHFKFEFVDLIDSTEFQLQVNNMRGEKEEFGIEMDQIKFPHLITPISLKEQFRDLLLAEENSVQIYQKNVNASGLVNELMPALPENNNGKTNSKTTIGGYVITKELLNESNSSVVDAILKSGKFHLMKGHLVTGINGGTFKVFSSPDEPLIIMDGAEVPLVNTDNGTSPAITFLSSLNGEGIDHVIILGDIESGKYALRGGKGAIEIYSATNVNGIRGIITGGLLHIYSQGFQKTASFKMPDYSNSKSKFLKIPDTRLSLFWDGNLITDNNGKSTIHFFASDGPTTYLVSIVGITANGESFSKKITINRN